MQQAVVSQLENSNSSIQIYAERFQLRLRKEGSEATRYRATPTTENTR